MNIAIIPARGGSQRIPRKNIRQFCGKPIIAHSIDAALKSGVVDEVVVSTDDEEIADIARQEGALVPFIRPASLADAYTATAPVIRHAISTLLSLGWDIEHCACIYATAPFLCASTIREGCKMLSSKPNIDYVFTATHFSFPIQRALLKRSQGGVTPFDAESIKKRSQDLAPAYHDAGQLYWANYKTWMNRSKWFFGPSSEMLELPNHLVCDIDTEEDWHRAQIMYDVLKTQDRI